MSPQREYLTKLFELVTAWLCGASCLLTFIKYKYCVLNTSTLWVLMTYRAINGFLDAVCIVPSQSFPAKCHSFLPAQVTGSYLGSLLFPRFAVVGD